MEWNSILSEEIVKILVAMALGAIIGIEREVHDKAAGLRTMMFISGGACLFTLVSTHIGESSDPGRVAAGIVTGVGFLGGGVIIRNGGQIKGLTTAAAIWLVAALGMGIGAGLYIVSALTTIFILIGLWIFPSLEKRIAYNREHRNYAIRVSMENISKSEIIFEIWKRYGLNSGDIKLSKQDQSMIIQCVVVGKRVDHDLACKEFLSDPEIIDLSY